MPYGINTNISATSVQRYLENSQGRAVQALGRLSSGMRINRAADDAAGMAIADRMTAQVRGNTQGLRNANDGVSALQTADGALAEITQNIQRIRELAVQAVNETNSRSDRDALQAEVDQLLAANLQIGLDAQFNGVNLLDGSFNGVGMRVGARESDDVRINIGAVVSQRSSDLVQMDVQYYQTFESGTASVSGPLLAGDLRINGVTIGASVAGNLALGENSGSAYALAAAITSAHITDIQSATGQTDIAGSAVSVGVAGRTLNDGDLTLNGQNLGAIFGANAIDFAANVKAAIDGSGMGITAITQVNGNSATISLQSTNGGDVLVGGNSQIAATGLYKGKVTITSKVLEAARANVLVAGLHPEKAGFTAGLHAAVQFGVPIPTLVAVSAGGDPDVSLLTTDGATAAILYADSKLDRIGGIRTSVGAAQNRLGMAIDTLSIATENMTAARSRVQDADYASETASLTRENILQNAGMAMLTQANALASNVLNLLR